MAKQDTFTSDEWTLIRLAPSLISSGVAAADPSGIFSSLKEAMAGARGMAEAFKDSSNLGLVRRIGGRSQHSGAAGSEIAYRRGLA